MLFSVTYLLPIATSLIYADGFFVDFVYAAIGCLAAGAGLVALTRRHKRELRSRDGFLLVTLGWVFMSAIATVPLADRAAGPDLHRRILRDDVRPEHDRRNRADRPRHHGAVAQPVAACAQLVRRHGHHRAGGRHPPDAGSRRHAALQGRDAGTGQGRKADSPHHADRACAVVRVLPDHARVHRQPAARRHELVRRHLPLVCDTRARRLLDLRLQRGALRFAGHRIRADRVHADLGDEFRPSFHRLAAEEPAHLRDGRRSQVDAHHHRHQHPRRRAVHLAAWRLPDLPGSPAPHRVQPGLDCHGLRLRQPGLCRVADVRADGHPDAVLLLREHRLDGRRHQDVPYAGLVPAGAARNVPARPSGSGHASEDRRPGRGQQDRLCRAGVRRAVLRRGGHAHVHAARERHWTSSAPSRRSLPASTTPARDSARSVRRATTRA